MAETEIKVSPEQFVAKAEQIAIERNNIQNQFDLWFQKTRKLCGQWQGDVSDDFMESARHMNSKSQTMLKILDEYTDKLRQLSGIYEKSELAAKQKNQSLPTDNVFR